MVSWLTGSASRASKLCSHAVRVHVHASFWPGVAFLPVLILGYGHCHRSRLWQRPGL